MDKRKCIYTGKEADGSDNVIPKSKAGDELHNWTNKVPCNSEYKLEKQGNMPSELEMEAHEAFTLMELHRNKAKYYELKLEEIQKKICKNTEKIQKKSVKIQKKSKKDKQIEQAYIEKEVTEPEKYEEVLEKRKESLWE